MPGPPEAALPDPGLLEHCPGHYEEAGRMILSNSVGDLERDYTVPFAASLHLPVSQGP